MTRSRTRSNRIYLGLILTLALLGGINVFLPQGSLTAMAPESELPASKWVVALVSAGMLLVVYGGLGFGGLCLSRKLDFPEIWDPEVSEHERFVIPTFIGAGAGAVLIIVDHLAQRWSTWGALPHPPFPASIVASVTAAIGEEVIFRLFFIPFWMWLISSVILKGRGRRVTFWVVATFSALAFALGHLPGVMFLLDIEQVGALPPLLVGEIVLLNGLVAMLAAYGFKRCGFLAAVGVHFWTDVVWHVFWGAVG